MEVKWSEERVSRFLVLAQEIEVLFCHVIAPSSYDLVDAIVVSIILQGPLSYGCLQVITSFLGILCFAPFEDLCEHAVNILWYGFFAEDVAINNPQVHSVGVGFALVLLCNKSSGKEVKQAIGYV